MNKWEKAYLKGSGRSHFECSKDQFDSYMHMIFLFVRVGVMSIDYYREAMIVPVVRDKARM